jgi:uncharacterized Rmd1/YagE family protein
VFHGHHDERSDAEKMTKREREEAKLPRLTAYTTAEEYRLKLLQAFLKREHGVGVVRVFDDCVYAVSPPVPPNFRAESLIRSTTFHSYLDTQRPPRYVLPPRSSPQGASP